MHFAVISDIHGNWLALEAVLNDIARHGVSDIVNLGDCFSGPLDPLHTAERLIPLGLPTVAGNHDRALVEANPATAPRFERLALDTLLPRHMDWLRALPETLVYKDKVLLTHGSPKSDTDGWIETVIDNRYTTLRPHDDIAARAENVPQSLMLCGHTHQARHIQLRDGRQIVNPGSVGAPGYAASTPVRRPWQVGSPHARYAIVAENALGWNVTFRDVPYDHAAMARLAADNGDMDLSNALAHGWVEI